MDDEKISQFMGEMSTDMKWVKKTLKNVVDDAENRYAKKWVEKTHLALLLGAIGWTLTQLLSLIPKAYAAFNIIQ